MQAKTFQQNGWIDDQYDMTLGAAPVYTVPHDHSPAPPASGNWGYSLWNVAQGRGGPSNFSSAGAPAATDLHSLTYNPAAPSSSQTKFVMEVQNWFCDQEGTTGFHVYYDLNTGCDLGTAFKPANQNPSVAGGSIVVDENDGHAYTGWTGWWQYADDARVVNMWDRGGDIAAFDWYGGQSDCPGQPEDNPPPGYYNIGNYIQNCGDKFAFDDHGFQDMVSSIENLPNERSGASMSFFLLLDHNAWNGTACPNAKTQTPLNLAKYYEPWCAATKMVADLTYAYTTFPYLKNSNYLNLQNAGINLPVIGFFQDEADDLSQCSSQSPCYYDSNLDKCMSQSSCFYQMYQAVTNYLIMILGTDNYYRIFAYTSGCPLTSNGHPFSDGCYGWVQPNNFGSPAAVINNPTAQGWEINGTSEYAKNEIDLFYDAIGPHGNLGKGANGLTALVMGGAFKGFDDYDANWGTDRILTQGCGTTWLGSILEPQSVTGSALPYMMVGTWDDYEEGTEIETGISNCLDDSSFVLSINQPQNGDLTWQFNFDSTANGVTFEPSSTISMFDVWASKGPTNQAGYFLAGTVPTSVCTYTGSNPIKGKCTIVISNYATLSAGTQYYLVVQAVGQPAITNHISNNSVTYTP